MNPDTKTTIEEQIHASITEAAKKSHEELRKVLIETVNASIDAKVNGKIDGFEKKQNLVNLHQNEVLQRIENQTRGVVELYDGSGKFFKASKTAAMWVSAIGGAMVVIWAFIRLVVKNAI